jgi:putative salt-induced outer membrane protein YdiY
MTSHEGRVEIVTNTGTKLEASTDMLLAVRNDAEQARYEKSRHADILHRWDGGVDAGMDLTRGNSETRSFRLALRAVRFVSPNRLTVYGSSIRSFDDLPTTADEAWGGMRFDHDFSSLLFEFANADFMGDGLQDLNLRSVLGGGIGYHVVRRERAAFDLLGGVNFTRENYDQVQRNLMAGQVW